MIDFGCARPRVLRIRRALCLILLGLIPLCLQAGTTTYTYDVHGRLSTATTPNGATQSSTTITYDSADNRASFITETTPNAPTGLTATVEAWNWIQLNWTASLDANGSPISYYKLYRGGTLIASPTSPPYNDQSLTGNTTYTYAVSAVDRYGYESAQSASVSKTTPPAPDTTPPTVPTNLQGTAVSGTQINLTWTASTDTGGSGLAGYQIFRNSTQIGTSTVASYSDTGLSPYTSYSYTVLAYDGEQNKSAQSGAVTVRTLDTVPPSAPGNPTFSAVAQTSATERWLGSFGQISGRDKWTTLLS